MHVTVDPDRCQGHTLCNIAAPTVFKLRDEDGHAFVEESEVRPELEASIRAAEATCPEQAIRVVWDK
jgi:ferredoxin